LHTHTHIYMSMALHTQAADAAAAVVDVHLAALQIEGVVSKEPGLDPLLALHAVRPLQLGRDEHEDVHRDVRAQQPR
jgi:hypothetical protein